MAWAQLAARLALQKQTSAQPQGQGYLADLLKRCRDALGPGQDAEVLARANALLARMREAHTAAPPPAGDAACRITVETQTPLHLPPPMALSTNRSLD